MARSRRLLSGNDTYKPGSLLGATTNQHRFLLKVRSLGLLVLLTDVDAGLGDCAALLDTTRPRPGAGEQIPKKDLQRVPQVPR